MNVIAAVSGLLFAMGGLALIGWSAFSTPMSVADVITMGGGFTMYLGGILVGWGFS